MWVKTHASQSNPTEISNVSICTQIWCSNRMKFFLSLITLCVLLLNRDQPSGSYMSAGSGLISTYSLHDTHWQGHCMTQNASKHFWDFPIIIVPSHTLWSFPYTMQIYLVSAFIWTRENGSELKPAFNEMDGQQLRRTSSPPCLWQFLPQTYPIWGPELATCYWRKTNSFFCRPQSRSYLVKSFNTKIQTL